MIGFIEELELLFSVVEILEENVPVAGELVEADVGLVDLLVGVD